MVRKRDDRIITLERDGIEVVEGNFLDYGSIKNALKDTDSAYFCYPFMDHLPKAATYFARAAEDSSTSLIVNMSQMNVHEQTSSPATQNHLVSEQIFDWSKVHTIHLRPALFAWNFLGMAAPTIAQHDTFYFPNPQATYNIIHPEDIGEVVAKLLVTPVAEKLENVIKLTGESTFTSESLARLFSNIVGRAIKYAPIPVDDWIATVRTLPTVNDFLAEHLREFSKDIADGKFDSITSEVLNITGHRPRPIANYFRQNLALFN